MRFHERGPRGQRGYTLVAIMIFITLLSIAILAVSPSVSMMMRRDREQELLFRGKQYAQAILNFQKRQGRFPLNLKELMSTKPRSARKLFKEPMCNCDDWGLIRVGQPWPPPPTTNNPAGDSMNPGGSFTPPPGTSSGGNPGRSPSPPPAQTQPPSSFPLTYTTPPQGGASGSAGGDSGNPSAGSGSPAGGDSFGGLDLGGDNKEKSNVPIIGVYSKAHQKGLQTFHGQEYYDQWGFIAGANNDPDLPGATIPSNPLSSFPSMITSGAPPVSPGSPSGGSGKKF
ncbi:MAG TPA: type II secretion system protein [Thermoanaerobaculia bacterium]|nr:type II secretion system protein [Thermoanaerobaculia bacterium]